MVPSLLLAQGEGLGTEVLTRVGSIAGLLAIVGILLVLPLFLIHRAEIKRLARWQELEPEKGEGDGGEPVVSPLGSAPASAGSMTPAERVTVDRPALQRITAERAALESPSFARRFIAGGPRHPLVLSLIAVVISIVGVTGAYLVLNSDGGNGEGGGGLDRGTVEVVVLNGSSQGRLAKKVGESLQVAGFDITGVKQTGAFDKTLVLFEPGEMRKARAVARELGEDEVQPMNSQVRSVASGAAVVVVAGEDRAGGGGSRQGGRGA